MQTLEQNLLVLNEIKKLKINWNHNKANPFSKELIEKVKRILLTLDDQPYVYPTANDSIQIEWETPTEYLEYEIYEDGTINRFYTNNFKKSEFYAVSEQEIKPL